MKAINNRILCQKKTFDFFCSNNKKFSIIVFELFCIKISHRFKISKIIIQISTLLFNKISVDYLIKKTIIITISTT